MLAKVKLEGYKEWVKKEGRAKEWVKKELRE